MAVKMLRIHRGVLTVDLSPERTHRTRGARVQKGRHQPHHVIADRGSRLPAPAAEKRGVVRVRKLAEFEDSPEFEMAILVECKNLIQRFRDVETSVAVISRVLGFEISVAVVMQKIQVGSSNCVFECVKGQVFVFKCVFFIFLRSENLNERISRLFLPQFILARLFRTS